MLNGKTRSRILAGFILLCIFICAGCAAHTLREAQDAARSGMEKEWKVVYSKAFFTDEILISQTMTAYKADYHTALVILDDLLANKKTELQKDNLLGTAMVLKAVCLWKLDRGTDELDAFCRKAVLDKTLFDEQKALLLTIPKLSIINRKLKEAKKIGSCTEKVKVMIQDVKKALFESSPSMMDALEEAQSKTDNPAVIVFILEGRFMAYNLYYEMLNKCEQTSPNDPYYPQLKLDWEEYKKNLSQIKWSSSSDAQARIEHAAESLLNSCNLCKRRIRDGGLSKKP